MAKSTDIFCQITWTLADLKEATEQQGLRLTWDELEELGGELADRLQDRSIEHGWDTLDILIADKYP